MRILGIDPGTHRIGWGVIERQGSRASLIDQGIIQLPPHADAPTYLLTIYQKMVELLSVYKPELVAIEKLFFQRNITTGIGVAQGRGVIILAITQAGLSYVEYSPNTIKSAVAGSGSAGKPEVIKMVGLTLRCDTSQMIDDAADALAVALTASGNHRV